MLLSEVAMKIVFDFVRKTDARSFVGQNRIIKKQSIKDTGNFDEQFIDAMLTTLRAANNETHLLKGLDEKTTDIRIFRVSSYVASIGANIQ